MRKSNPILLLGNGIGRIIILLVSLSMIEKVVILFNVNSN